MIAKVAITFISEDDPAELLVDSGRILAAMTGNPNFANPDPSPSLASVGTLRGLFLTAVNNVNRSSESIALRDQARVPFETIMRALANYVEETSAGNLAVLLSSGFPAQKSRQPAGPLPAPVNLRLRRPELSSTLKAKCKAVEHAGSYQWRMATSLTPTEWTLHDPTTGASATFTGLTPGTVYVVQVRAIGAAGPSDWSDPAMLMAV